VTRFNDAQADIDVAVPVERVWEAITDPEQVSRWFGDLHEPLRPGRPNRLDFGDGDFFTLDAPESHRPHVLRFSWRFLGVEAPSLVTWTLCEHDGVTTVDVRQRGHDLPPTEVAELQEGWRDFLDRLAGYLRHGRPTRYAFRDRIDGSVRLPRSRFQPLHEPDLYRWMPIATDGFAPRWFFIVDSEGPRRFGIARWEVVPGRRAACEIAVHSSGAPTRCVVELETDATGARLRIRHDGWSGLGIPARQTLILRRRFTATWLASLDTVLALSAAVPVSKDTP
jgi:uncharacterized protein YndB with AHSA1/START domain